MDHPLSEPGQLRAHLRTLRKAKGLTHARLGAAIGVGQQRIADIEKNPAIVSVEQLFQLLTALDRWLVWHREGFVAALLHEVDPDPYRDQIRGAILRRDAAALVQLANQSEALRQPVRYAAVLGGLQELPIDRR